MCIMGNNRSLQICYNDFLIDLATMQVLIYHIHPNEPLFSRVMLTSTRAFNFHKFNASKYIQYTVRNATSHSLVVTFQAETSRHRNVATRLRDVAYNVLFLDILDTFSFHFLSFRETRRRVKSTRLLVTSSRVRSRQPGNTNGRASFYTFKRVTSKRVDSR